MPFVAEIGIRIFMPINKDYIGAISIAFGLVMAFGYTMYLLLLNKVIVGEKCQPWDSLWSGIFLSVFHFLPFLVNQTGNLYMYASGNTNSFFNYTLPALLNAGLVCFLLNRKKIESMKDGESVFGNKGFLVLFVYLAIFSNILHSVILVAYICSGLVIALVKTKGNMKEKVLTWVRNKWQWLMVLVIWLISLRFEMSGGRANGISSGSEYISNVTKTLQSLVETALDLRMIFVLGVTAFIIGASLVCLCCRDKSDKEKLFLENSLEIILSLIIVSAYLVLVCAKAGSWYITRADVFSDILFYVILWFGISFYYLIQCMPQLKCVIPLSIFILICATLNDEKSYRETNCFEYMPKYVKAFDDDLMNQIIEADQAGETVVVVKVPSYSSVDNFPLASTYGGERIAKSLFVHGMTEKKMEVILEPDKEMNIKYHLKDVRGE